MRPLASDALLAMFQITMGEATEKAGERTLQERRQTAAPQSAGAEILARGLGERRRLPVLSRRS